MSRPAFILAGQNATRAFGLSPSERARRFAVKAGLTPVDAVPASGAVILANLAFAWDPAWLRFLENEPGLVVTMNGVPALAHCPDPPSASAVAEAMAGGEAGTAGLREMRAEDGTVLYNHMLRKRESAYLMPLTPATARAVEKASYDGAYKGVTDVLTLYLWRGLAFHLTRWAAAVKISPNMVTTIGALFCVIAFFLFKEGWFWTGIAAGFVFMVLDTVDGKLARCTGTSSKWGNVFDHGLDLIHPPFWYWAWGMGLDEWGRPLAPGVLTAIMAVILIGYVVQRLIEGAFMRSFDGIHIHVWERIDSRFRLITARRNPNMVILIAALLLGRPDTGLELVAWWTALSCLFHLVRLIQAYARRARGGAITSWLA
ncbi:CDP-alcohol phosphatidyltransferase family protein [Sphingomonas sp. ID0503]|uniref:CDP-alcohol phosphatidyltransferase family protein n=1 Tax=Sphingomonas sp. ID0503 TaxID=3399691 RepID=UPI003AFB0B40